MKMEAKSAHKQPPNVWNCFNFLRFCVIANLIEFSFFTKSVSYDLYSYSQKQLLLGIGMKGVSAAVVVEIDNSLYP